MALISWFGYSRDEYYKLHYQAGDAQWEELGPDQDGDGCVYEDKILSQYNHELGRQAVLTNDDSAVLFRLEDI